MLARNGLAAGWLAAADAGAAMVATEEEFDSDLGAVSIRKFEAANGEMEGGCGAVGAACAEREGGADARGAELGPPDRVPVPAAAPLSNSSSGSRRWAWISLSRPSSKWKRCSWR